MINLKNIGKWKISIIEAGTLMLDGGAMMGAVPKVLWEKTNPPDSLNRIKLAMRCLLLDDGENVVLIETGIGDKYDNHFKNMFAINQEKNILSYALSKHGYLPENITHVLLTHLHFDHAGGATELDKTGLIVPTFSNAKYYISENNWKAGKNPNPKDRASYLSENYESLEQFGVLNIIPENYEILPGISTYVVNGHTQGQQLIKVESNKKTIVFCSDLIPLKSHIKVPWIMGYDLNASLTLIEKEKFLSNAAKEDWILFFYHDPETVAVKIKKDIKYFKVIDEYKRR